METTPNGLGMISIGAYVEGWKGFGRVLLSKWKTLTLLACLGLIGGGLWGYLHPQKHQARMLIAVEDDDSNGWQNLLSQFGIDVGGNNPGGIFKGESLVRLFKTLPSAFRPAHKMTMSNLVYT